MSGTVSAVQAQKRNPKRVNVYVDGVYAFPVAMEVALKEGLRRGLELTDDDIARLTSADDLQKAYGRALAFLSYRPRSVAEVRRNLEQKQLSPEVVSGVLERLAGNGLLDDAAFARFWVENREAFSPRSRRLLTQELRQKGLPADEIAAALPEAEADNALEAARRKAKSWAGLDYDSYRRKLLSFLQRRGFAYEDAREATEAVWRETRGPVPSPGD